MSTKSIRSRINLALTAVLACAALYATAQAADRPQRPLPLPPEFAAYRSWKPLMDQPQQVPLELWVRCMAPTQADWEAARVKHGPHSQKLIQVYANADAHKTLKKSKGKALPAGAILAKEKFEGYGSQAAFSGVAFMVKRSTSQFPETGGWEFRYFPSSEDERAETHAACAACHKTAASGDYVFGEYLKK